MSVTGSRSIPCRGLFLAVLLAWCAHPLQAVVFFGTADPTHNTTAPTGVFQDSGWKWQIGGGFCGTVISPHFVATARHLGLKVGAQFKYHGLTYSAIRVVSPDTSDLSLLEVAGRLPDPAPLFESSSEVGRPLVLMGRGGQRGDPVFGPPPNDTRLQGWMWGAYDSTLRWGTNSVDDTYDAKPGDNITGSYLASYFSDQGGDDLATLSVGDSGGGAFVLDQDGLWKLAGVNFAVEAQFNTTTNGPGFYAALFNRTGFYEFDDSVQAWTIDPTQVTQPGTIMYLTRISVYAAWIHQQFERPPDTPWPVLLSSTDVDGPYTEHPNYAVQPDVQKIIVVDDGQQRFYKLDGATTLKGPVIDRADSWLQFEYQ